MQSIHNCTILVRFGVIRESLSYAIYVYTGLTASLETMSMPMGRPEPDVLLKHNKRYHNDTKGYNDGYTKPTLTSSISSVVATLF